MILENYEITCSKYVWPAGTDLDKINIFSDLPPQSTETIDLKPFLIDMGEITWNLETTDEEDGKSNLYYEESDVTYELSGIVQNGMLVEFFGLYRDTTTEKYLISVKEQRSGTFIHRGIVSQELIEMNYSPKADSEIIKVTAMGYLKEFKAYFSTKPMLHEDTELVWDRQQNLPNVIFNSLSSGHVTYGCSIRSLLTQTFHSGLTNINFILEPDIEEWYIIKNPCLSKRLNYAGHFPYNSVWIKSSYERIRVNGENRFDFIRRLCNAMGWIFYYSDNNFYIKNRSPIETEDTLDFNNVMEYTLTKLKETSDYDTILIIDGSIGRGGSGGYTVLRGEMLKIFTNQQVAGDEWWDDIESNGDLDVVVPASWRVMRFHSEDDKIFKWKIMKPVLSGWLEDSLQSTEQIRMLRIDAGDSGNAGWEYDMRAGNNGETRPIEWSLNPGEDAIAFKGCYGSALFKVPTSNQVFTYQDYKNSQNFVSNFDKFFANNLSRRVKFIYKGIISNPLKKYNIANGGNIFNGDWITVSLKLNLITETTQIELQLKSPN